VIINANSHVNLLRSRLFNIRGRTQTPTQTQTILAHLKQREPPDAVRRHKGQGKGRKTISLPLSDG